MNDRDAIPNPLPETSQNDANGKPAGPPQSGAMNTAWGQKVIANMDRMSVDEDYRKMVAKNLS